MTAPHTSATGQPPEVGGPGVNDRTVLPGPDTARAERVTAAGRGRLRSGSLRPGTAGADHPRMTENTQQAPSTSPVPGPAHTRGTTNTGRTVDGAGAGGAGDQTRWADAVAELRRLRRDEVAAYELDEWAAAADLRNLFAGHAGNGIDAGPTGN